ncbi:hypothetical protein Bca4012_064251 [Brassica carinata]
MCNPVLIQMVSVKVIRNKHTGLSEGYGFVEFLSHEVADKVLKKFNGTYMPNTDRPFRLNWASFSTGEENEHELSIFVGNLAPDVSDSLLHNTFSEIYPSVKDAIVVIDAYGRSKGFGFVRFRDVNERTKAMTEMHGVKCSNRAMRIAPATPKETTSFPQQGAGSIMLKLTETNTSDMAGMYMTNGATTCPAGDAKPRYNYGNQWFGAYYGGQHYNGYGYTVPQPHDPRMYAVAPYGGYPVYGGPQQQVSR